MRVNTYSILLQNVNYKEASVKSPIKLIIQIPCLNQEETVPQTLCDLPVAIEAAANVITQE